MSQNSWHLEQQRYRDILSFEDLETRYAPAGTKITVKKNLFVMVRKGDSDDRSLYMRGMRIDTKDMNYDFADNILRADAQTSALDFINTKWKDIKHSIEYRY